MRIINGSVTLASNLNIMKTHEIREEFILEAHKAACPEWKSRIEREVPELFKTRVEAGNWYKHFTGAIVCVTDAEHGRGYGVDYGGDWIDSKGVIWGFHNAPHEWTPATKEQVTEALYKECERRYEKDWRNVKIKAHADCSYSRLNNGGYQVMFYSPEKRLWNTNGILFNNGLWAEALEDELTDEAKKDLIARFDEIKSMMEKHNLL